MLWNAPHICLRLRQACMGVWRNLVWDGPLASCGLGGQELLLREEGSRSTLPTLNSHHSHTLLFPRVLLVEWHKGRRPLSVTVSGPLLTTTLQHKTKQKPTWCYACAMLYHSSATMLCNFDLFWYSLHCGLLYFPWLLIST